MDFCLFFFFFPFYYRGAIARQFLLFLCPEANKKMTPLALHLFSLKDRIRYEC